MADKIRRKQAKFNRMLQSGAKSKPGVFSKSLVLDDEGEGKSLKSLYDILGVDKKCTKVELEAAFIELGSKWHPDAVVHGTKEEKARYLERYEMIVDAYKILSDEKKRKEYDIVAVETFDDIRNASRLADVKDPTEHVLRNDKGEIKRDIETGRPLIDWASFYRTFESYRDGNDKKVFDEFDGCEDEDGIESVDGEEGGEGEGDKERDDGVFTSGGFYRFKDGGKDARDISEKKTALENQEIRVPLSHEIHDMGTFHKMFEEVKRRNRNKKASTDLVALEGEMSIYRTSGDVVAYDEGSLDAVGKMISLTKGKRHMSDIVGGYEIPDDLDIRGIMSAPDEIEYEAPLTNLDMDRAINEREGAEEFHDRIVAEKGGYDDSELYLTKMFRDLGIEDEFTLQLPKAKANKTKLPSYPVHGSEMTSDSLLTKEERTAAKKKRVKKIVDEKDRVRKRDGISGKVSLLLRKQKEKHQKALKMEADDED